MSSMFMIKDHRATNAAGEPVEHKKGEVVSVPFGVGKQMIAAGVARYWNDGQGEEPPEAEAPKLKAHGKVEAAHQEPIHSTPEPPGSHDKLGDKSSEKPGDKSKK